METSHEENEIKKIVLSDGEAVFFDSRDKKYKVGFDERYEDPCAEIDTFVAGKNGPLLEAHGGDCRVLTFFEREHKLGAVIHIGVEDLFTERHEELINILLQTIPGFSSDAEVYLFGDIDKSNSVSEVVRETRFEAEKDYTEWNGKITKALKERGFKDINEFSEGEGKYVTLKTTDGSIQVCDDKGELIFSNDAITSPVTGGAKSSQRVI